MVRPTRRHSTDPNFFVDFGGDSELPLVTKGFKYYNRYFGLPRSRCVDFQFYLQIVACRSDYLYASAPDNSTLLAQVFAIRLGFRFSSTLNSWLVPVRAFAFRTDSWLLGGVAWHPFVCATLAAEAP